MLTLAGFYYDHLGRYKMLNITFIFKLQQHSFPDYLTTGNSIQWWRQAKSQWGRSKGICCFFLTFLSLMRRERFYFQKMCGMLGERARGSTSVSWFSKEEVRKVKPGKLWNSDTRLAFGVVSGHISARCQWGRTLRLDLPLPEMLLASNSHLGLPACWVSGSGRLAGFQFD